MEAGHGYLCLWDCPVIKYIYHFAWKVRHSFGDISGDPDFVDVCKMLCLIFNIDVRIFSAFLELIQQTSVLCEAHQHQYWL